jgi:hypothetical protein
VVYRVLELQIERLYRELENQFGSKVIENGARNSREDLFKGKEPD